MSKRKKPESTLKDRIFKIIKILFFAALGIVVLLFFLHGEGLIHLPEWFVGKDDYSPKKPTEGSAQVHFIDVGQGDCTLIISDDGKAMLIDAGEEEYGVRVVNYLAAIGVDRLDYIVCTHPHSDHIGGMKDVIDNIPDVGTVIIPKIPEEFTPTTASVENLLDAIEDKGCELKYAKEEILSFGGGTVSFILPDYHGDNLNNYSIVTKFVYKNRAFLMSGDLEWEMEQQIRKAGYDLGADVYKLAHHGSSTSNQVLWLAAISPKYCVCECGANNIYGHPHSEVVQTVDDLGIALYRTDLDGSVTFETDGESLDIYTEKQRFLEDI